MNDSIDYLRTGLEKKIHTCGNYGGSHRVQLKGRLNVGGGALEPLESRVQMAS